MYTIMLEKQQQLFVQGYNLEVHDVKKQHFYKSLAIILLCEISAALHLAQPGLMADRQTKYR